MILFQCCIDKSFYLPIPMVTHTGTHQRVYSYTKKLIRVRENQGKEYTRLYTLIFHLTKIKNQTTLFFVD